MNLLKQFLKHFLIIAILSYPIYFILSALEFLNPIEKELTDIKFADIYFGHFQEKILDSNIYFIDVGREDKTTTRRNISEFINTINKNYKPKIIVVDVDFKIDHTVTVNDNERLVSAISSDNIVLGYNLIHINGEWLKDRSELPFNYNIVREGFTNNLVEEEKFGVERFFQPSVIQDNETFKHLSIVAAEKARFNFDKSLLKDNNQVMINFKYNYHKAISISDTNSYFKLKDKIIIIGLFTKNKDGKPLYNEDLHYTASNPYYLGKSPPNMYGGEVIATIISNLKNDTFVKYYKSISLWINIILSILVYINLLHYMGKSRKIFTTVSLITQFGLVPFFIIISIFFVKFNIYLDLTIVWIISFFSVEIIRPIEQIINFVGNILIKKETL